MEKYKYEVYGTHFIPVASAVDIEDNIDNDIYITDKANIDAADIRQPQAVVINKPPQARIPENMDMPPQTSMPEEMPVMAKVPAQTIASAQMKTDSTKMVLGMAYVPVQESIEPYYEPTEAFKRGTMFKKLDLPWEGVRYCK